jgi:hypothetical protein
MNPTLNTIMFFVFWFQFNLFLTNRTCVRNGLRKISITLYIVRHLLTLTVNTVFRSRSHNCAGKTVLLVTTRHSTYFSKLEVSVHFCNTGWWKWKRREIKIGRFGWRRATKKKSRRKEEKDEEEVEARPSQQGEELFWGYGLSRLLIPWLWSATPSPVSI